MANYERLATAIAVVEGWFQRNPYSMTTPIPEDVYFKQLVEAGRELIEKERKKREKKDQVRKREEEYSTLKGQYEAVKNLARLLEQRVVRLEGERRQLLARAGMQHVDYTLAGVSGELPSSSELVPRYTVLRDQEYEFVCTEISRLCGNLLPPGVSRRTWQASLKGVVCRSIVMRCAVAHEPTAAAPVQFAGECVEVLREQFGNGLAEFPAEACRTLLGDFAQKWLDFVRVLPAATPAVVLIEVSPGGEFDGDYHEAVGCSGEGRVEYLLFPGLKIEAVSGTSLKGESTYRVLAKANVWANGNLAVRSDEWRQNQ